jgi:hypothetical protein
VRGPDIGSFIQKFMLLLGITLRSEGITGCYPPDIPTLYFLVWIPGLMFEVMLCLLVLYKAWKDYKNDWRSSLSNLLVRDRSVSHHSTVKGHVADAMV